MHLTATVIGRLFKLPSFPSRIKQIVRRGRKPHVSNTSTRWVSSDCLPQNRDFYAPPTSAACQLLYVSTASGNSCRTGGSPLTSRRNRHVLKAEKRTTAPRRTKEWVDTPRYIGVTVVKHVGLKAAETVGRLGTVLNEGKGLSVRKCVIHYKQLFGPVTDCACPICVCATQTHVGKTQVAEERDLAFGIICILTLVASKFTGCGELTFRWPHQKSDLRVSTEN